MKVSAPVRRGISASGPAADLLAVVVSGGRIPIPRHAGYLPDERAGAGGKRKPVVAQSAAIITQRCQRYR